MHQFIQKPLVERLLYLVLGITVIRTLVQLLVGHVYQDNDPDTWLRLVLIQELYEQGGWYSHFVARDNFPYGISIHWSHALDILLFIPTQVLAFFMPLREALALAGAWLNPILLMTSCFVMFKTLTAVSRTSYGPAFVLTGPVIFITFMFLFTPGQVDHHTLLLTIFLMQLNAAVKLDIYSEERKSALLLGALGGLGLWASVEYLAPLGALMLWLGYVWIRRGEIQPLVGTACGVLLVLIPAFLLEQPPADWGLLEYDALSILHICLMTCTLLAALALEWINQRLRTPRARLLAAGLAGSFLFLMMHLAFPHFWLGPLAAVTPEMKAIFLDTVTEMQPAYTITSFWVMAAWFMGCMTIPKLFAVVRRNEKHADGVILILGMVCFFSMMMFISWRWCSYLTSVTLLALALWLDRFAAERKLSFPQVFWLGVAIVLFPLVMILTSYALDAEPKGNRFEETCTHAEEEALRVDYISTALGGAAPKTIMLDQDYGPMMLYFTPHNMVASNYHRNAQGFKDLYAFFHAQGHEDAKAILQKRNVAMVVMCPPVESIKGEYPFIAALFTATPPDWLREVKNHPWSDKGLKFFRVHL